MPCSIHSFICLYDQIEVFQQLGGDDTQLIKYIIISVMQGQKQKSTLARNLQIRKQ